MDCSQQEYKNAITKQDGPVENMTTDELFILLSKFEHDEISLMRLNSFSQIRLLLDVRQKISNFRDELHKRFCHVEKVAV